MDDLVRLTEDFAISPQLAPADFALLKAEGFASVLNARPDEEAGDFLRSGDAAVLAKDTGLGYAYSPTENHAIFEPDVIDRFEQALIDLPKPILAHCKSGTRSAILWALVAARHRDVDDVIGVLKAAGQDLSFLEDELREAGDEARQSPLRLRDDALAGLGRSRLLGGSYQPKARG